MLGQRLAASDGRTRDRLLEQASQTLVLLETPPAPMSHDSSACAASSAEITRRMRADVRVHRGLAAEARELPRRVPRRERPVRRPPTRGPRPEADPVCRRSGAGASNGEGPTADRDTRSRPRSRKSRAARSPPSPRRVRRERRAAAECAVRDRAEGIRAECGDRSCSRLRLAGPDRREPSRTSSSTRERSARSSTTRCSSASARRVRMPYRRAAGEIPAHGRQAADDVVAAQRRA